MTSVAESKPSIIDFLKSYLTLVGGFVLLLGLVVNSPDWPRSVRLEALNPVVVLNVAQFYDQIKAYGLGPEKFDDIMRGLGIGYDPKEASAHRRFIVFPLEWYYPCYNRKDMPSKVIDKIPDDWSLNWRLVEIKKKLGYKDPDLKLPVIGRRFSQYENQYSIDELRKKPGAIWQDLFITDVSTSTLPATATIYQCDPFHRLFEQQNVKWEKVRRYEALINSAEFFSPFVLINNHWRAASNLKVTLNVPRNLKWAFIDRYLTAGDMAVTEQHADFSRLEIASLRPGPDNYKLLLLRSPEHPIHRDYVYLDDRGFVKEIAEYYRWILGLPLVILILWFWLPKWMGVKPTKP